MDHESTFKISVVTSYPQEIIDPATYRPFQEAQVLWPCGGSLSKKIALEFFDEMTNDGRCAIPAKCLRCKKFISAYNPNLQNLVNFVLKVKTSH